MGSRLYEEFKKKLKVPPVQRFEKRSNTRGGGAGGSRRGDRFFENRNGGTEKNDIVIAIPLKGGTGVFS